jgi:hypothetical protein
MNAGNARNPTVVCNSAEARVLIGHQPVRRDRRRGKG